MRALLPPLAALLTLGACMQPAATPPAPIAAPVVAPATPATARFPNDLHWARNSAEHRAIYIEVYRTAADRLGALASGRSAGRWGVILDVDETVLDNSEFQVRRIPYGGTFDPVAWNAWVREEAAPALPGAVPFTTRVRAMGGRLIFVSNRTQGQCPATRRNLTRVGIPADLVLCETTTGDKNARFQAVERGTAAPGIPPLAIVEWIGDNIEDFPALHQDVRTAPDSAFARFGRSYFALPDAMYGSWQRNPQQ